MSIDWITVSAQIVNFLILIWLLKHFLYQPVISAMDRREERIAERLNEARERIRHADEEAHRYRQQTEVLDQMRDDMLREAEDEARERKSELVEEARREVADARESWMQQVEHEQQELLDSLRREAARVIQITAGKALRDLADTDLEQRIIDNFIGRLEALEEDVRRSMADSREPVRVQTAGELDSAMKARLTRALHQHIGEGLDVEYERSPALLCGIQLTANARRVGWNLSSYMEELTARIDDAFGRPTAGGEAA